MTTAEKAADARLRRIYKKTLADKNREIEEQGNKCAICGRPYPEYILNQDHDHACCKRPRGKKGNTATFCGLCCRGWICYLCNKWAIGSLEYMEKVGIDPVRAIAYLRKWKTIIKARGGYASKAQEERPRLRKTKTGVRRSNGVISKDPS